jgi:hypothetical protein
MRHMWDEVHRNPIKAQIVNCLQGTFCKIVRFPYNKKILASSPQVLDRGRVLLATSQLYEDASKLDPCMGADGAFLVLCDG